MSDEASNSVIGLDLGSHHASIAIWDQEKDRVEVIADDLGSRTIPTTVGYRGDEVLIGQAASAQEHKNSANTFSDVRARLMCGDGDATKVHVPLLNKDVPVTEVGKHFFRNIHNQVKQQLGKVVRECVLSVPAGLSDADKARIVQVAMDGGVRIKAVVPDTTAVMLAYGMDAHSMNGTVFVLDMGWSRTEMALFDVRAGVMFPKGTKTVDCCTGEAMVEQMTAHCAKDFKRKSKNDCSDNKKSMLRLRKECEQALKQLSMGTEVSIDIDSLFDGVDYSGRVTRARVDDLCAIPFMQLKNAATEFLAASGVSHETVTHVCMAGGLSSMPKSISMTKALFSKATMAKPERGPSASGMTTTAEAQCAGAAMRGRELFLEERLMGASVSDEAEGPMLALGRSLALTADGAGDAGVTRCELFAVGTPLPVVRYLTVPCTAEHNSFRLVAGGGGETLASADDTPLADVGFSVAGATTDSPIGVKVMVEVSAEGETSVVVTKTDQELASITVAAGN
jgi:L1 cell adhesion molecule like protein